MGVMGYISIAVAVFLVIGFLIGFLRSWKKSLIRASLLLVCAIASIFLSSVVSNYIMTKFVSGLVLSIFGFTVNFEELAQQLVGDSSIINDLFAADGTTTKLANMIMNIVINLASFIVLFLALWLITLIIYWIISICMSASAKKKSVGKVKAKGWERLIGGAVGVVSIFILFFGIATPFIGTMEVCDKFIEETQIASAALTTAPCYASDLYDSSNEKSNENSSVFDETVEKYVKIRKEYKNSFAGTIFKISGVDTFGRMSFNH